MTRNSEISRAASRLPRIGGALAIATAALLTGCVAGHPTAASPSSTPSSTSAPHLAPAPLEDEEPSSVVPVWDDGSREQALQVAAAAVAAFAHHQLDQAAWWAEFSRYLSPRAAQAYSSVQVANIPVSAVTGAPALVDESSPYLAVLEVPTDVGTYQVQLSRLAADTPWLVERLAPAGGQP